MKRQQAISIPINQFLIYTLLLVLLACEKAEKPYVLPQKPNAQLKVAQINLGEKYTEQVYVNLFDSVPVKASLACSAWDLAFEAQSNGFRIFMNGGNDVRIAKTSNITFQAISNPEQLSFKWDEASGGDAIFLNNWCNPNGLGSDTVYIVDRGLVPSNEQRFLQLRLLSQNATAYAIEIANLDASNKQSYAVLKDNSKEHILVKMNPDNLEQLNVEPNTNHWQLCFLKYRWIYYEFKPPLFYQVTGVFINTNQIEVAVDSTRNYEDISQSVLPQYQFSSNRDIIGFDWKIYDFTNGKYWARKHVTYILALKGSVKKYYKLRFTDFYSSNGLKGSPKFEWMPLY
jgi:hypothetical protein